MIGVGEAVADIPGVAAVEVGVVDALAVGVKVRASRGKVEGANEAADLRAAAGGGKAATFSEKIEFGNAGGPPVADDLDYTGHGVRTVEGAFSSVDNFDFVYIVERQIGVVEIASRQVDGRAINQNFREAGVAAIKEKRSQAAEASGTGDGDSRLRGKQVGKRHGLALVDLLPAN